MFQTTYVHNHARQMHGITKHLQESAYDESNGYMTDDVT